MNLRRLRVFVFAFLAAVGLHLVWYNGVFGRYGEFGELVASYGQSSHAQSPSELDREHRQGEHGKGGGGRDEVGGGGGKDGVGGGGGSYEGEDVQDGHSLDKGMAASGEKEEDTKAFSSPAFPTTPSATSAISCSQADGIDDIVYIIKTGSTEAMGKLPVHFNTTFQCYPHVLIFSDYAETMGRHIIHDALDSIIKDIRVENKDFELWRRLRDNGRATLEPWELSEYNHVTDPNAGGGQPDNGGWRLDKFKNLPMVGKTLALKPGKKWYIYTDADTFISRSNLVRWTKMLDHTQPMYLGSPAMIDDQVFAHGGSGYLLSQPAMQQLADLYIHSQPELDRLAARHWAGDCVLSTTLAKNLSIALTWAFPIIQGGDPTVQDFSEFGYERQIWCYPTVSYHHLTPETIQSLWEFEKEWTSVADTRDEPIRHKNTFKQWALPQMIEERSNWDNGATDEVSEDEANDLSSCRAYCEKNLTCLQYSFGDKTCRTFSGYPKLGFMARPGWASGWLTQRVGSWAGELDGKCSGEGEWITG